MKIVGKYPLILLPMAFGMLACNVEPSGGDETSSPAQTASETQSGNETQVSATQSIPHTPTQSSGPQLTQTQEPGSPSPTPSALATGSAEVTQTELGLGSPTASNTSSPVPTPTATQEPTPIVLDADYSATWQRESLAAVSAQVVLSEGEHNLYLADSEGAIQFYDGTTGQVSEWQNLAAPVTAAAPYDDTYNLWVAAGELYAVNGETTIRSALSDSISGSLQSMLLDEQGRYWFSSSKTLALWEDGVLSTFIPGDLPVKDAELLWGPTIGSEPALWVLAEGSLYALLESAGSYEAWPQAFSQDVNALSQDGAGHLWALMNDGSLARRESDEHWQFYRVEDEIEGISGASGAALWLSLANGDLLRLDNALEGTRIEGAGSAVFVDGPWDRLIFTHEGETTRLSAQRQVYVSGLVNGQQVSERQELLLVPTWADNIDTLLAVVDDLALELEGPPYTMVLEPSTLAEGLHYLEGSALYNDGEEAPFTLSFTVGDYVPPTWGDDIEALYHDECQVCHSSTGGARPLYEPEQWEVQIELILTSVRSGLMPKDPYDDLTEAQVALIEAWRDTGFTR